MKPMLDKEPMKDEIDLTTPEGEAAAAALGFQVPQKTDHCRKGLCSASWRMGGCECNCEQCSDAMRVPQKPTQGGSFIPAVERLPSTRYVEFTVEGTPIAMPRYAQTGDGGAFIRPLKNGQEHPVKAWKKQIAAAARLAYQGEPWDGPISLRLIFMMPRPERKNAPRSWHIAKPDLDNLAKAVKDALNNIVWVDDSRVCTMSAEKRYCSSEHGPFLYVKAEWVGRDEGNTNA